VCVCALHAALYASGLVLASNIKPWKREGIVSLEPIERVFVKVHFSVASSN